MRPKVTTRKIGPVACGRVFGALTKTERASLDPGQFGLPEKRAYPMPDGSHAAVAKGRARTAYDRGHLTRDEYDRIVRKADRILQTCKGGE